MYCKHLNVALASCAAAAMVFVTASCQVPEREPVATDVRFEQGVQVVDVRLDDFAIHMPRELSPGATVFVVRNVGDNPHTITISGEDTERTLDPNLEPGAERELHLNLQPGEYEVWCPVGMHAAMGMRTTFTVREHAVR